MARHAPEFARKTYGHLLYVILPTLCQYNFVNGRHFNVPIMGRCFIQELVLRLDGRGAT